MSRLEVRLGTDSESSVSHSNSSPGFRGLGFRVAAGQLQKGLGFRKPRGSCRHQFGIQSLSPSSRRVEISEFMAGSQKERIPFQPLVLT